MKACGDVMKEIENSVFTKFEKWEESLRENERATSALIRLNNNFPTRGNQTLFEIFEACFSYADSNSISSTSIIELAIAFTENPNELETFLKLSKENQLFLVSKYSRLGVLSSHAYMQILKIGIESDGSIINLAEDVLNRNRDECLRSIVLNNEEFINAIEVYTRRVKTPTHEKFGCETVLFLMGKIYGEETVVSLMQSLISHKKNMKQERASTDLEDVIRLSHSWNTLRKYPVSWSLEVAPLPFIEDNAVSRDNDLVEYAA